MRVAAAAVVALVSVPAVAAPPERSATALQETRAGVTIDWGAGTLTTQAGAAADLRLPSADAARPGAVRRARATAASKLKEVLAALPLGGDRSLPGEAVQRALERARLAAVEYQSNGGAVVSLVVHFSDWLEGAPLPAPADAAAADGTSPQAPAAPKPADLVIAVPAARLAAAPTVKVGKQETALGVATYRLGSPPPGTQALSARSDRAGRLVLEGAPAQTQKFAGAAAVIYVQKVTK